MFNYNDEASISDVEGIDVNAGTTQSTSAMEDGLMTSGDDSSSVVEMDETPVIGDSVEGASPVDEGEVTMSPEQQASVPSHDGEQTHTISFGARLQKESLDEITRQMDAAKFTMQHSSNDVDVLDAMNRYEQLRKTKNEMIEQSDQFKQWKEHSCDGINSTLDYYRKAGLNIPDIRI